MLSEHEAVALEVIQSSPGINKEDLYCLSGLVFWIYQILRKNSREIASLYVMLEMKQ